jgi:vacuolar protein sorting-associated protein 16
VLDEMSNPFDDSPAINPFDDTSTHIEESCPEEAVDTQAEASWQYLGDLPYRRIPIYANVQWEGASGFLLPYYPDELRNSPKQKFTDHRTYLSKTTVTKCVGCPNGGPIALITLPLTNAFASTKLRILTNSGKALAIKDFPMEGLPKKYTPFDVLTLGFTDRCTLVVVLKDSLCITLNFNGGFVLDPFYAFGEATELKLAQIYEGGLAVLATNRQTAVVELLDEHDSLDYVPHPSATRIGNYAIATILPTADRPTHYCAIAVLSRTRTAHRHPEVFVSTTDLSVISINAGTLEVVDLQARLESPIVDMAFAPNGRFLACFTESSTLTVISTNFETKVLDFDTSEGSNHSPPLSMEWCGEDSVVLHWKNLGLLMVGPYGDWLRFPYESTENVFLISEIDCCRVITDSAVELLQRVPPATASLLSIGSIDTTAMLLDASDAYHSGSPTSDEATRSMLESGSLDESVETCMDSATKEFDIDTQKRLLRAATYGMHFGFKKRDSVLGGPVTGSSLNSGILPSKIACNFVQAARKLRVLNALRNPNVGFVLTSGQFDAMTATGVVARLVAMKRAALAAEIAKYFGLPKSVQLFARASKASAFINAVNNRLSDSETAERAIQILNGNETSTSMNRGGYAAVAMTAKDRPGVANLLLMMETSVADKVPALISTGSYADAIAVATTAR